MKRRGRPILAAISGFFFGLFLTLTLILFGAVALDTNLIVILPIAGLLLGVVLGLWPPLGGRGPAGPPSAGTE